MTLAQIEPLSDEGASTTPQKLLTLEHLAVLA